MAALRQRFALFVLKLLTHGAPRLTRKLTSAKIRMRVGEKTDGVKHTKPSFFETRISFRRFRVERPRHSGNIRATMRHRLVLPSRPRQHGVYAIVGGDLAGVLAFAKTFWGRANTQIFHRRSCVALDGYNAWNCSSSWKFQNM